MEQVTCNWCEAVSTEGDLVTDQEGAEFCPACGRSGFLMDKGATTARPTASLDLCPCGSGLDRWVYGCPDAQRDDQNRPLECVECCGDDDH